MRRVSDPGVLCGAGGGSRNRFSGEKAEGTEARTRSGHDGLRGHERGVAWKGLWSLPEVRGEGSVPADGFIHDFSHYRLSAHVWRVEGAPPAAYRELVEMRQVPWEEVAAEAVPTPVKTFLAALARS